MKPGWADLSICHLRAGELVLSKEPLLVSTILGSCISVTMFHPRLRVGAICHGLLPNGQCEETSPGALRYVDCSIHQMLRRLEALGVHRTELEIKLFGGADVLLCPTTGAPRSSIGNQNVRAASLALGREGVHVVAQDVGGERGRKLLFLPHTGEVYVKRLRKLSHRAAPCAARSARSSVQEGAP